MNGWGSYLNGQWLSSDGVRGEAKQMGGVRSRMAAGCRSCDVGALAWLSSIGVQGEAKRMGGGHSRLGAGCCSGDVGALAWLSGIGV